MKAEEGISELQIDEDSRQWIEMASGSSTWNFNRGTLRKIVARSRIMYLINPLIKRAVTVQELYVWGSGAEIKAADETVQAVLDDYFKAPKNQTVIGQSWEVREREQRIDGNTFFVIFRNKLNGAARVRLLPFDQIIDIVYNPEDSTEPWFYCRQSAVPSGPIFGPVVDVPPTWYPDADYDPFDKPGRAPDGSIIDWNTAVIHVKTGGLSQMTFGLPELYSVFQWATQYKKILENFATVIQAYARIAMKMTGLAGKSGVAAAKSKLNTSMTPGNTRDTNPPNNTGGWGLYSGNVDISPVKTANSTTGPDEARALRSMVASGSDTPEHFFGDSDVGNFATSSTLDRPTELKMVARQKMWGGVILRMCDLLIRWSAVAPKGKLRQAGYRVALERDGFDGTRAVTVTPPTDGSVHVEVKFPSILTRDVTDRVRSVVQAATLGGSPAEGIIPNRKMVCKLLLQALGEEQADYYTNLMYPEDVLQGFADPADKMTDEHLIAQGRKELGDAALTAADASMVTAKKPAPKLAGRAGPAGGSK